MIDISEFNTRQELLEKECCKAIEEMYALKQEVTKIFDEFAENAEIKSLLENMKAKSLPDIRVNIENNLGHIHEIHESKTGKEFIEIILKMASLSFRINSLLNEYSSNQCLNILRFGGIEIWMETWLHLKSSYAGYVDKPFVALFSNNINDVACSIADDLYGKIERNVDKGIYSWMKDL